MRILYLGENRAASSICQYYGDYLAILSRNHRVHCYGPGYPQHDPDDGIDDVLAKAPFAPELIVVGATWENEDPSLAFDPQPRVTLADLDVPRLMFLNKEYKKLEQKAAWIERNRIDVVLSTVATIVDIAPARGTRFVWFPFAIDTRRFHPAQHEPELDVGFLGSLHLQYTALRLRMRQLLEDPSFGRIRVQWGDFERGGTLAGESYAEFLRNCKVGLCTPSACDIVGTRFYEIMASGSLLFCPESTEYGGLFVPGEHCVTFRADLSDFRQKLLWILSDEQERERIVANALALVRHDHSIEARTLMFDRVLVEVLGLVSDPTESPAVPA